MPHSLGELVVEQLAPATLVEGAGSAQVLSGVASVEDLADQTSAVNQPQPDRWPAVSDGVRDQLAGDQFGDE
ncbi:hypothetical protein [Streptomyces kanasensis]|uniref:hypothetical protein n=1 Tax=Streptomyces kanasensis TaxID=936756 RepID=UPI003817388E